MPPVLTPLLPKSSINYAAVITWKMAGAPTQPCLRQHTQDDDKRLSNAEPSPSNNKRGECARQAASREGPTFDAKVAQKQTYATRAPCAFVVSPESSEARHHGGTPYRRADTYDVPIAARALSTASPHVTPRGTRGHILSHASLPLGSRHASAQASLLRLQASANHPQRPSTLGASEARRCCG